MPEDRNVIFVADLKNNKIYDSINNTKEINEALGIKGDEIQVKIIMVEIKEKVKTSQIQ